MTDTRIRSIEALEACQPPEGAFILLIEPRRIPPHLALIENGRYYSLSVKGVEVDKNASELLRAFHRKGKEVLLIGLSPGSELSEPSNFFLPYRGWEPPTSSCLGPIIDRCGLSEGKDIGTVHDLVAKLEFNDMLRPPHYIKGWNGNGVPEEIRIPAYRTADVRAHLDRYQERSSEA